MSTPSSVGNPNYKEDEEAPDKPSLKEPFADDEAGYDEILAFRAIPDSVQVGSTKVASKGIFTITAVMFFIIFMILAIVAGSMKPVENTIHLKPNISGVEEEMVGREYVCLTKGCLRQGSFGASAMMRNVEPCDNFYYHSCGSYLRAMQRSDMRSHDFYEELKTGNEMLVDDLIKQPISEANLVNEKSAEWKMKTVFKICKDDFANGKNGGWPVINIINENGGLDLFSTTQSNWKFGDIFVNTHATYMADAFFTSSYIQSIIDPMANRLDILKSGLGLKAASFYLQNFYEKYRVAYKQLIVDVMSALCAEYNNNHTVPATDIDNYSKDVMEIETEIAKMQRNSPSASEHTEMTIKDLNDVAPAFPWLDLYQKILGRNEANMFTVIALREMDYIKEASKYIQKTDSKKLQHYLTWNIALSFLSDLSWEYIHAFRKFETALSGTFSYITTEQYCLSLITNTMPEAISNLYVKNFFEGPNRGMALSLVRNLQKGAVETAHFMSQGSKAKASDKMRNIKLRVGYPDSLVSDLHLTNHFGYLVIKENYNHFNVSMALRTFQRSKIRGGILNGPDPNEWGTYIYKTLIEYSANSHAMTVPAGILQTPFFEFDNQHYTNFGAVGFTISGHNFEVIANRGAQYNSSGMFDPWWDAKTKENFASFEDCLVKNMPVSLNFTSSSNNEVLTLHPEDHRKIFSKEMYSIMAVTETYRSLIRIPERALPGMPIFNQMQGLFMSIMQSSCAYLNEKDEYEFIKSNFLYPLSQRFHNYFMQLQDFREAYGCVPDTNTFKQCPFVRK